MVKEKENVNINKKQFSNILYRNGVYYMNLDFIDDIEVKRIYFNV